MAPDCPPGSILEGFFTRRAECPLKKDPLADQSGDQLLKRQVHQLRYLSKFTKPNGWTHGQSRAGQQEALQAYTKG